jgi:hypothetical protein
VVPPVIDKLDPRQDERLGLVRAAQARQMEARERAILQGRGFADLYGDPM